MKYGHDLSYNLYPDFNSFGYKVVIKGYLNPEDKVYYTLKY